MGANLVNQNGSKLPTFYSVLPLQAGARA